RHRKEFLGPADPRTVALDLDGVREVRRNDRGDVLESDDLSVPVVLRCAVQRRRDLAPTTNRRTEWIRDGHIVPVRIERLVDLRVPVRDLTSCSVVLVEG